MDNGSLWMQGTGLDGPSGSFQLYDPTNDQGHLGWEVAFDMIADQDLNSDPQWDVLPVSQLQPLLCLVDLQCGRLHLTGVQAA